MLSRTSIALLASLTLLGACAASEPAPRPDGKHDIGDVLLRISTTDGHSTTTALRDDFISAELNTLVPVLDVDDLCPKGAERRFDDAESLPCGLSFRITEADRKSAKVEFVFTDTSGSAVSAGTPPVQATLLLNQPVGHVVKAAKFVVEATYLDPVPRDINLPTPPTAWPVVYQPFRLF